MIEMEEEAREERGYRGEGRELGVKAVKVVVGNKCDLRGMRQVSAREGLEWARGKGCGFMETSAREMVNIEETFARAYRPFPPHLPLHSYATKRPWVFDAGFCLLFRGGWLR